MLKPEARARQQIAALLAQAGWALQEYPRFTLTASRGVAVSGFPLQGGTPDYLLFVDRQAVGVIAAIRRWPAHHVVSAFGCVQ